MKTNQTIVAAGILAVALVVMGFLLSAGIVRFKQMDRKVCVKGLCEREVMANKVIWPLIYKEIGNDPAEMYDRLAGKNRTVVSFLKNGGVTDAEISINPPMVTDRQADNYGNEMLNYRYKATGVITVTSTDVDKVRKLMARQSDLMKQGIAIVGEEYGDNTVRYEYTSLNDIKPEMVEEATKNARATAQKFADDSGSTLGKIVAAQQGQFTIDDRDANTPYIKKVRVVNTLEYSLE